MDLIEDLLGPGHVQPVEEVQIAAVYLADVPAPYSGTFTVWFPMSGN